MKNINFTLLGQYKFIQTNIILLFLLISSYSVTLNAQDGGAVPVATMQYSVYKTVTYGIPENADFNQLDDYDIAAIRPFSKSHTVKKELFSNGNIRTTCTYPNGKDFPDTWIKPIYKTKFDYLGVTFYDENNVETYHRNFDNPIVLEPVVQSKIDEFEYYTSITIPSQSDINSVLNSGYQYISKGDGSYIIYNDSISKIYDPIKHTFQTKFIKNGELVFDETMHFILLPNGKYIIGSKVNKHYIPTYNGHFNIEVTDIEEYYNFYRNNTNLNVVNSMSSNRNTQAKKDEMDLNFYSNSNLIQENIKIYPNPTYGELKLELNTNESDVYKVSIQDISGKLVKSLKNIQSNSTNTFDINDLQSGIYILKCESVNNIFYQKIVKN